MAISETGVVAASPTSSASVSGRSHWSALPVLLAGSFMVVLDFFIVNVALPSIGSELHAGESSLEWVVAGYGLSFSVLLITAGRLGDEFGRRRVFSAGLALFTLASLACGVAPSPATLVIARVAQGASAALVMPQVLSTIAVTYRGADHARALSLYGMVAGLAAVGGQVVGGALLETDFAGLGWRACFLINVPVGLVALALCPHLVPESRNRQRSVIGLGSVCVLAIGLVAVLLPLIQGRQHGWPLWSWGLLAGAPIVLGLFLVHQRALARRGSAPLFDLGLFRERAFSAGLATQLALASVQAAFFVYLALYLQEGRGLDPLEAGLVFTILAAAYVAASGPAPGLTARHGGTVVALGGACLVAGTAGFAGTLAVGGGQVPLPGLVPALLLVGAGIGLCFTPIQQIVLGEVAPDRAGAASGMLGTTQQLGFALGVAVSGIVFFGQTAHGTPHAFEATLWQMAVFAVEIVAAAAFLPRPRRVSAGARPGSSAA